MQNWRQGCMSSRGKHLAEGAAAHLSAPQVRLPPLGGTIALCAHPGPGVAGSQGPFPVGPLLHLPPRTRSRSPGRSLRLDGAGDTLSGGWRGPEERRGAHGRAPERVTREAPLKGGLSPAARRVPWAARCKFNDGGRAAGAGRRGSPRAQRPRRCQRALSDGWYLGSN